MTRVLPMGGELHSAGAPIPPHPDTPFFAGFAVQIEEAEGRHAFLIKVYKQKVKHILLENKTQLTDVKTDSAMAKKLAREEHTQEEYKLRSDKRNLKVELKEQGAPRHRHRDRL